MAGRRITLFIVLLLVIAAVSSAVAPRQERLAPTQPQPEPPAAPPAAVVEGVLPGRAIRARVGDVVRLEVRHASRDTVEIARLGIAEPVEAGLPAQLVFDADRAGHFVVTLREAGRRIGTVDVRDVR